MERINETNALIEQFLEGHEVGAVGNDDSIDDDPFWAQFKLSAALCKHSFKN